MYQQLSKQVAPALKVFRSCKQTIYEFQHYLWDDYRRNKEELGIKDQVKKKDDHFMDCLRYIYNFDPRFFPVDDEEDEELDYTGEYVKYPKEPARGGYHSLIENQQKGGYF